MSQENVEIVRRGYERLAELGSPDPAFLDSEVEWYGPREFPDLAEPHYGHDGVRRYIEKVNEAFEDYRMVPEEFIDAGGDQVLVFSREGGRGKGSGAEVQTNPTAHLWTLRDGKAIRMQSYWDRADALKAAGLSKSAMSQEDVEIVRQVYEDISRNDLEAAFEAAEPGVELIPPGRSPESDPVRGIEGIMAWLADQQKTVGDLSLEVEDLIKVEEVVVALLLLRISPHGSEAGLELRIAHLWTLRDGKLIRCEVFPERKKALEAAGLSE